MILLRPADPKDAAPLFPLIFNASVTDTIAWDGPSSLEDFEALLRARAAQSKTGCLHTFTMIEESTGQPVGLIRLRADYAHRAEVGIWIGTRFHGRGYGTEAVRQIVRLGFERFGYERIEARVFTGNIASRRMFEKNGFVHEGTVRHSVHKRGQFLDEWIFGIVRGD